MPTTNINIAARRERSGHAQRATRMMLRGRRVSAAFRLHLGGGYTCEGSPDWAIGRNIIGRASSDAASHLPTALLFLRDDAGPPAHCKVRSIREFPDRSNSCLPSARQLMGDAIEQKLARARPAPCTPPRANGRTLGGCPRTPPATAHSGWRTSSRFARGQFLEAVARAPCRVRCHPLRHAALRPWFGRRWASTTSWLNDNFRARKFLARITNAPIRYLARPRHEILAVKPVELSQITKARLLQQILRARGRSGTSV